MLFLLILCAASTFIATALLVRFAREHARRYGDSVPQRFHIGNVPRLGGAAMFVGCTIGWTWMVLSERIDVYAQIRMEESMALGIWVVTLIPVAGGVIEDLTQRLRARHRMLLTVGSGIIAVSVLQLTVARLGIPMVDELWQRVPLLGVGLALVGIAGLPHAFNLIDGYNGLAGLIALICCFALAYVALQVGDRQLAALVLTVAGSTAGFLVWNYPKGLIFAGDGGAYLWGTVISIASVLLVLRHPLVSPWFPVLLLIYPVQETLFSIYRKAVRGQSPGMADALHFHQLVYRRLVRQVFHDDEARRMLMRNNRTSPYLWSFGVLTVTPAVLFWNHTPVLIAFVVIFIATYIWAYSSIVRFKLQRWVRRRR